MSMNQFGIFANFVSGVCLASPAFVAMHAVLDAVTQRSSSRLIGLDLQDRGARLLVGQWCVLVILIAITLVQSWHRTENWWLFATAAATVFVPGAILSLFVEGSFFSRINLACSFLGLVSLVLTVRFGFPAEGAPAQ
jgi:hypothetical protein